MMLESFNLIKVDKNDETHNQFLKELFQNADDKSMEYIGDLSNVTDDNAYIVLNNKLEKVGYFTMSIPIINHSGLSSSSLYYAISPKYRGLGYATKLLGEISDYLLNELDMIVLSVDKNNEASKRVALNNNFRIIFETEEDDEILFAKETSIRKKGL